MRSIRSLSVLLPPARPTQTGEVASVPDWRAVREAVGASPAQMAIHAGRAALAAAAITPSQVGWVLHCGSGVQASVGWPVHHHVQHGIVGSAGNAIEVRQYCAGGLMSWVLADRLAQPGGDVVCTGADNWSWTDRFATSRSAGGEPFSDAAHAAVVSEGGGFAQILGWGTASCPDQSEAWRTRDAFHETASMADYVSTLERVGRTRTSEDARNSFLMLQRATTTALADAGVSAGYVTHFVPHGSRSGEPYRQLARVLGLPWAESLHEHALGHGYLGVSCQAAGLLHLAESQLLLQDSIVLLLAAEYLLSATAVVLHIARPPEVGVDGPTLTVA
ncbi:beta-ketoacyl-[acyl-carrier-protein] synthase family protein [Mycolicibacterium arenosum]|uniref:3-oxoacyl-ACP synthase n=1 Tax=Mycolicibacterium arenosum TaxID=2952157 RepID=A0ABT1LXE4_9MYCO|nr:hypothetical protein [Mycolicibacterium sp. CAU 1645]MCP9271551.1 hypothetical protein [Mycolicibacterium sp. CAU 1645]